MPHDADTPTPPSDEPALPRDDMLPPAPDDLLPEQPIPQPPQRDKGLGAVEPLGAADAPAAHPWGVGLVSEQQMRDLWRKADVLQRRVNREINNTCMAKRLLDHILTARNALRQGPDQYEEAERLLNEIAYRLELQQRVRTWSREIGYKLFFYEVAWVMALVVLMLVAPQVLYRLAGSLGYSSDPNASIDSIEWLVLGLKSALWGGLGGVTGALYALWRHIALEQDFDPQYTIWYLSSPIMGTVLGAFAFLAVQAGLFSLTAGMDNRIQVPAVVFLLAWMSGFQQNVVYNIVRRMLQALRLESPEQPSDLLDGPVGPSRGA